MPQVPRDGNAVKDSIHVPLHWANPVLPTSTATFTATVRACRTPCDHHPGHTPSSGNVTRAPVAPSMCHHCYPGSAGHPAPPVTSTQGTQNLLSLPPRAPSNCCHCHPGHPGHSAPAISTACKKLMSQKQGRRFCTQALSSHKCKQQLPVRENFQEPGRSRTIFRGAVEVNESRKSHSAF